MKQFVLATSVVFLATSSAFSGALDGEVMDAEVMDVEQGDVSPEVIYTGSAASVSPSVIALIAAAGIGLLLANSGTDTPK